jgi:hypothetical protein
MLFLCLAALAFQAIFLTMLVLFHSVFAGQLYDHLDYPPHPMKALFSTLRSKRLFHLAPLMIGLFYQKQLSNQGYDVSINL